MKFSSHFVSSVNPLKSRFYCACLFAKKVSFMTGKIQCDGCRQQFTHAEMRAHLSIDAYLEKMKGVAPAMNNRGNRATTAPVVNFNDPQLSIQLCPRRAERTGSAGAGLCDERAPESLPIVLPGPLGRRHLEELKDELLFAWEARQRQRNVEATMAALAKDSGGSHNALRPRQGRNVIVGDDVLEMLAKNDRAAKAPPPAPVAMPKQSPASKKSLPDFMKPLQRTLRRDSGQRPPAAAAAAAASASPLQPKHHDPQEGGGQRPHRGLVVLSAGQVTPVYVRI
jgi:hypothetical protein